MGTTFAGAPGPARRLVDDGLSDDPVLRRAIAEVAVVVGGLARAVADERVADALEEERRRVDALQSGPSAHEVARAMLEAIEALGRRQKGTAVGAHEAALRAAREAGCPGLDFYPRYRRTRASCDEDPSDESLGSLRRRTAAGGG